MKAERRKRKVGHRAHDVIEDAYLAELAHARMRSFDLSRALTHEQVWGHLIKRRHR